MTDTSAFEANLNALIKLQRSAYLREGFPTLETRLGRLQRTAALLAGNRDRIAKTLSEDFGHRSHDDTRMELLGALGALRHAATKLESWLQPERYTAMTPDAGAWVEYTPRGVVGVIGPWNYPIVTVFGPLAGILAAGNRAIIKPSELTPVTSDLLARLVADQFEQSEVSVVQGAAEEGEVFAASALDHIIFTGSATVAKQVMKAAANNLTPVTLELGGKSPAIVTEQFDLAEAARRIMAVKTKSAGQVCLAPDYALVPRALERDFAMACVAAVEQMFPQGIDSAEYTSIISDRHYHRLEAIVANARANGAEVIEALPASKATDARRFVPTLLLNVNDNMLAMHDEIFGPVLPIVGYDHLDEALAYIRSRPHPLGLSYFGADDRQGRAVLDGTASGGVTINDVMVHMFGADMPFGGVGASGMGCYFGKAGFQTFSHARAIYRQGDSQDAAEIFRPPYGERLRQVLDAAIAQ
jgi:coniferyl-aldehyde dehydrogenase